MIAALVGARLFHVFYESYSFYREDWWRIFYLWNGGFVSYGGAFLSTIAGILFLRHYRPGEERQYLDLFAPVCSLAYALGRTGCLLAGCCYGKYCNLPWAIQGRHPTQLYASVWEIGILLILLGLEKTVKEDRPNLFKAAGSIFFLWMILHGLGRMLMESFRDDFRGPIWGLSIASWISLCLILLGAYFLAKHKKPTCEA